MSYALAISPRDDEQRRIEQIHRGSEDFADVAAAVPDHPARFCIAAVGQRNDIADMADRATLARQRRDQCPTTRDGFQTTCVAASAPVGLHVSRPAR